MLRTVAATRYVTPFREGGSLPGLCEADDDGLYVVKFHGAGQGPKALVAEVLVGELGRALGLPIPELVLVELDARFAAGEPHWEVKELLDRSPGTNLGVDFLPGALGFTPAVGPAPDPELAAAFVWLDALTINVDRTPRNPNLLVWHKRLYGIDHGAALYVHHRWSDLAREPSHPRRPFPQVRDHVLLPFAGSIVEADARLAPQVTAGLLGRLVDAVPAAWLDGDPAFASAEDNRAAYVDYLRARLAAPRAFVEEAERARTGA
jgi:HipA-like kinase